jgi:NADH-ubiquinone oxidoreductase chain 5
MALFFMCIGSVIHSIDDSQDICFIGGLYVHMHYTSSCLIVSSFAVCGMLFLVGFYSRD